MKKNAARMRELARRGGKARSTAKIAASRANARKARAAAAAKRTLERGILPPFHPGERRPPVLVTSAPEPEERLTTAEATATQLDTAAPSSNPTQPRPAARRWAGPQLPPPPTIKSEFDLAVRAVHRAFIRNCTCSYCRPHTS